MNNLSDLHGSLRAKAKSDAAVTEKANQVGTVLQEMQDVITLTANDLESWSGVSKDDVVSDSLLSQTDGRIAGLSKLHDQAKATQRQLRLFA